ncbi:MAG: type VI secretion system tip protein VgrG [Holosporales bacterium]|jgi:type VI secretion system secreted protein VgrG|nr:type VI secretion system tip protein VgrG [Holosporales bacterium]
MRSLLPNVNYEIDAVNNAFFARPILFPPTLVKEGELSATVSSPLGADTLFLESFEGRDAISEPFEFNLRGYAKDLNVDFKKLLGEPVSVCLNAGGTSRYFSGIAAQVRSLQSFILDSDESEKISFYGLTLKPAFWKAQFTKNTRIFFKKDAKSIIEEVLDEDGITFTNKASACGKTVREYCVQYNESNFDFVSRLMEEEGILYFFTHSSSDSTMILAGKNKDAESAGSVSMKIIRDDTINTIRNFNFQNQIVSKKYESIDYNYTAPDTALKASASGEGLLGEVYEYPGGYAEGDEASNIGTTSLNSLSWPQNLAFGDGYVPEFGAGVIFELKDHIREDLNQKYLLYSTHHSIAVQDGKFEYSNTFVALPESVPFAPFRKTKRPYIHGTQTAVVVGTSGNEISCDEQGRVLVQFHWDREGGKDGAQSLPVRCMQGWAGSGYGWSAIPRIGMEVVVSFSEGNPDRPLIIGCVYNGVNKPPAEVENVPEILALKTQTSPQDGEKANLMTFDDRKDQEKITFKATKDFETWSEAADNLFLLRQDGSNTTTQTQIKEGLLTTEIEKGEYKLSINEGNYSIDLKKGSLSITMDDGDNVLTVKKGNYTIKLDDGELSITTKGAITVKTDDAMSITAAKDISVKTDAGISVEAAKDIIIKSNAGISIQATKDIELKATGSIVGNATKNVEIKATSDFTGEGMNIKLKATMNYNCEALQVGVKATTDCTREGLNITDKAQLNSNREGLMIKDDAKLQGMYGATLMIEVNGKVQANVKGGVLAGIAGAITALG